MLFLLFILLLRPASASEPYLVAIEQSNAEAALILAEAQLQWSSTAALFASVNTAATAAISNMTAVYNASSPSAMLFLNASFSNGPCLVPASTEFYSNATVALEYLCCITQKLRAPGLLTTYTQMCSAYLPGCTSTEDPTATLLDYIRQITNIVTVGLVGRACLDDWAVITPQTALVQAISAASPAGILLQTYQDLAINAATLQTCVQGLSPSCRVSGPLNTTQAPVPDLDFPDVAFDAVCGWPVLSAFELSRFTTTCTPPTFGD